MSSNIILLKDIQENNLNLTEIILPGGHTPYIISLEFANELLDAMYLNNQIHTISLEKQPYINNQFIIKLADLLSNKSTITRLSLNSCPLITNIGIAALASMLERNTSLISLGLSIESLDEASFNLLSKALGNNNTLKELELRNMAIKPNIEIIKAIANILKTNTTLTSLHIFEYLVQLDDISLEMITDAIKYNFHIISLGNKEYWFEVYSYELHKFLDEPRFQPIRSYLKRNEQIIISSPIQQANMIGSVKNNTRIVPTLLEVGLFAVKAHIKEGYIQENMLEQLPLDLKILF